MSVQYGSDNLNLCNMVVLYLMIYYMNDLKKTHTDNLTDKVEFPMCFTYYF